MRTTAKVLVIAVGLGLGAVLPAWADTCFLDSDGHILVGKGFTLPSRGQCKAFNGYYANTPYMLTGGACATSDNAAIELTLTAALQRVTTISLSRESLTGFFDTCPIVNPTFTCHGGNIIKVTCPASRPFGS